MKKLLILILGIFLLSFASATINVTLNSPADDSVIFSNPVTFDIDATTTNYMNNITLWTNETGTWEKKDVLESLTSSLNYTDSTEYLANEVTWILKYSVTPDVLIDYVTLEQYSGQSNVYTMAYVEFNYQNGSSYDTPSQQRGGSYQTKTYTNPYKSQVVTEINVYAMRDPPFNTGKVRNFKYYKSTLDTSQSTDFDVDNLIIWNVEACDVDGTCEFATNNFTVSPEISAPDITIIYPTGIIDYGKKDGSLDLNWTVTDAGILDTCWYNYNGTNTTVICNNNHTTFNLSTDNSLIFYANDTLGNTANETIEWDVKVFENNRTHNTSSYETKSETFSINLTANSSLTAVQLEYNGTLYSTTKSGTLYSRTIDIPIGVSNNTVRWKFTYAGETFYSDYSYQDVELINFSLCDGSLTNDFLNISFKDEADLDEINASITLSTFEYYLGSGTVSKTYTFTNTSNNYNYRFCATPTTETFNVNPYVQYKQGTDYPQRIWDAVVQAYTSTVTQKILYLLNTVDGIYVTFQVINSAEQGISGVSVTGTRTIEGEEVIVANGETDSAGGVTFWLNPDFVHDFNFTKDGYESLLFTTAPTQSSYTVTMTSGETVDEDCTRGVSYSILPAVDYLDQNTNYNFSITTTSSYWNFDNYTASLYYGNGTLIDSKIGTTQEGSTLNFLNVNVTNQSTMYMTFTYTTNETLCLNSSRNWFVQSTEGRDFSLFKLFSDIDRAIDANIFGINGESGDDTFGRALIAFLILVIVAGTTISRYGIQNETAIMGILFGLVLLLDVGFGLIPTLQVGDLIAVDYFFSAVTFITFIAFLIKEERY